MSAMPKDRLMRQELPHAEHQSEGGPWGSFRGYVRRTEFEGDEKARRLWQ